MIRFISETDVLIIERVPETVIENAFGSWTFCEPIGYARANIRSGDRHQFGHRHLAPFDDHFLARQHIVDEPGQVRFRFVD